MSITQGVSHFHWNSNIQIGKFQHFNDFYWKVQQISIVESRKYAEKQSDRPQILAIEFVSNWNCDAESMNFV